MAIRGIFVKRVLFLKHVFMCKCTCVRVCVTKGTSGNVKVKDQIHTYQALCRLVHLF
jgi:hypothetical protein